MDENSTTPTTPANEGNSSTMIFVLGAIILAGILGYVIFSSTNNETNTSDEVEESSMMEEDKSEDAMMEEEGQEITMNDDAMMEASPEKMEAMDLNLNEGTGESMDTTSTSTDVKVLEVEAGFPYYKPNLITVKKGDTVRIIMNSVDMTHDLVIDELNVRTPIKKAGESATVEFVADKAGSFEYYCSVGQHRANGMFGTLVVQE